jgi:hypothetical protein
MAFNPDIIRTGLVGPSFDYRRRRALLDDHLLGRRNAYVDPYADIGGVGQSRNACDNAGKQKLIQFHKK